MIKAALVTAAATITLTLVPCSNAEPLQATRHLGLELEVSIDQEAEQFSCTASISDLASGEVLSAPRVTGTLGSPAMIRSGSATETGSDSILLTVQANADGEITYELATEATTTSNDTIKTIHQKGHLKPAG